MRRVTPRTAAAGSEAEILRAAERLLRVADVDGRLPTPVEDLVAAADLVRGSDEIFAPHFLARAPKELRDAVRGLIGRVRAALDRREREIYINPEVTHQGRRNFQTLHEVGHEILPWQSALAYADDDARLAWTTRIRFEREANLTSAELLFQRELFAQIASEYAIGMATVVEVSEMFGASIHAGFRRFVETHRAPMCGMVIDCKPWRNEPPAYKRREVMSSATWDERFARPLTWPRSLDVAQFPFLALGHEAFMWGSKTTEWGHEDLAGNPVELKVELFSNTYNTLILIWVPQRERLQRRRVIAEP